MINSTQRSYGGADDLARMQDAVSRWYAELGDLIYPHPGDLPHRIYNGNRGRYPLDQIVRLWEREGDIVGMGLAYPNHTAFDAWLAPAQRGTNLEREIVKWCDVNTLRWMKSIGKEGDPIMGEVIAGDETRRATLQEIGYTNEGHIMNMTQRTLDNIPQPQVPDGFTIRAAGGIHEADKLATVHSASFGSEWTPELYREAVMNKPGYDFHNELVVVAPDGRFAAFTVTWYDGLNKIGYFEPVGTATAFQRRGLASALMYHAMHIMRERGMTCAQVNHEQDNEASSKLYAKLGFRIIKQVHDYHNTQHLGGAASP